MAPIILNLCTKWDVCHLRGPISFIPARKASGIHWIRRQGGPEQGSGRFRKEKKNPLRLSGIKPRFLGRPAHLLYRLWFFFGGGEYFTASCIPSGSVSVFVEYNASLLYPQADSNARKFQKGITHGEQKKTIHLLKIPNRCLPEELHSCYVFTTDRP